MQTARVRDANNPNGDINRAHALLMEAVLAQAVDDARKLRAKGYMGPDGRYVGGEWKRDKNAGKARGQLRPVLTSYRGAGDVNLLGELFTSGRFRRWCNRLRPDISVDAALARIGIREAHNANAV